MPMEEPVPHFEVSDDSVNVTQIRTDNEPVLHADIPDAKSDDTNHIPCDLCTLVFCPYEVKQQS